MNLKSSAPQNKPLKYIGLLANLTGSILVSPTISTIFQNDNNYNDLACKLLKLLGYLNCLVRRWTDFTPTIICKLGQNYPFYRLKSSEIVCNSLSIFWKIILTQNRTNKFKGINSLFLLVLVCDNAYCLMINKQFRLGD